MSGLRKLVPSTQSLLVFEAAARLQSFKAAAAEMNVTQPNVSHSIRALENHLGVRLFERGNRGVSLTASGSELYADLAPALGQIERRIRSLKARESRTIVVAASTSASAQWLLPITAEFQRAHPEVSVRIDASDRDVDPGGEVDLAIRRGPKDWRRRNCWRIADEVLFAMCSPAYLEKAGPLRDLSDLPRHAIIHNIEPFRERMQWRTWLEQCGAGELDLPETLVLNDYQLAIQACIAGEGIALGWSFTTQTLIDRGVLVKPLPQEVTTDHAFHVLGAETANLAGTKLQFVHWLTGRVAPG